MIKDNVPDQDKWDDLFEGYADGRERWSDSNYPYPNIHAFVQQARELVIAEIMDNDDIYIAWYSDGEIRPPTAEEVMEKLKGNV